MQFQTQGNIFTSLIRSVQTEKSTDFPGVFFNQVFQDT